LSLIISSSQPIANKTTLSWPGIEGLRSACLGMVILEIENLSPTEGRLFTPRELNKSLRMLPRRRKSFTASRISLKNLCRQLGLVEETRPDQTIETLGPDDQKPCLAESGLFCSVSHSSRFVVAVAHNHPVGVDIEGISNKILKIQRLFLSQAERQLLSRSGLDFEPTATLVWSIKEAAAKALGLHLFQAIHEVEVIALGQGISRLRVQEKTYFARSCQGEGQVIVLVTCDDL
jgi:phosphopantetheinyl transferase